MQRIFSGVAAAGALLLAACGGGSSNDDPAVEPNLSWAQSAPATMEGGWGFSISAFPDGSAVTVGNFDELVTFATGLPGETTLSTAGYYAGFLARHTAEGGLVWAKKVDATESVFLKDVVTLSDGSFAVTGWFTGVITLAPGEVNETIYVGNIDGWADGFLAKFAGDGSLLWSRHLGSTDGDTQTLHVAATTDGQVALGGLGDATFLTFGAGEPNETTLAHATMEAFVAKFDAVTGNLIWVRDTDTTIVASCWGLDGLPGGGVAAAGRYGGTTDFGGGISVSSFGGTRDCFVAAWDAAGTPLWARTLGGSGDEKPQSLAVSPAGQVIVTGSYAYDVTAGSETAFPAMMVSPGMWEVLYVASYGATGDFQWLRGVNAATAHSISTDVKFFADGAIALSGSHYGEMILGQGEVGETTLTVTPGAETHGFVARYTPGGMLDWAVDVTDTLGSRVLGVAPLTDGTCVTTGYFSGTAVWGTGDLNETTITADSLEAFFARHNADGGF